MIDQKSVPPSVIDPVCGMSVSPNDAAGKYKYQGVTYYFCSLGCAEKFRANPARYLESKKPAPLPEAATPSGGQVEYTCPMHPEVRQLGPGSCPKCGMALEPTVTAPVAKSIEYTCPMHPQIVRSEPGACPICGMALEPREVTGEEINPELVDMTRRFWISLALTLPTLLLMVSSFVPDDPLKHLLGSVPSLWLEFALATPVVLWGRLAILSARLDVGCESTSEYVHADSPRYRSCLFLQRIRPSVSAIHSSLVPGHERRDGGLF